MVKETGAVSNWEKSYPTTASTTTCGATDLSGEPGDSGVKFSRLITLSV